MAHLSRLTVELRRLLAGQRVAALGTLDDDGLPLVTMVPFAIEPQTGQLVVHVSGLAAHSANLLLRPAVSLLVMQAEQPGQPVHALPRVSLRGQARVLPADTPPWLDARRAYLARFPEAEPMTQLGDFRFFVVAVSAARQIAGFGAARSVTADELLLALRGADASSL
jgi:putative heme iron utilization protein